MRNPSHKTTIASIRDCLAAYRKEKGWSREAMAMEIVAAHERIGGPELTGIAFESSGDAFTTAKKNADRIWRWLDDETKDNNLLPANFQNSILAALPIERRVELLNEILFSIDCAARGRYATSSGNINPHELMQTIMRANHRTEADAADLLDGVDPGELPRLHSSLVNDIRVKRSQLGVVEAAMHAAVDSEVVNLRKVS